MVTVSRNTYLDIVTYKRAGLSNTARGHYGGLAFVHQEPDEIV